MTPVAATPGRPTTAAIQPEKGDPTMTPAIIGRTLPSPVATTLAADYREALDDLEAALDEYEKCDFFGPDEEGRINFTQIDAMHEAAGRVLRLARLLS